MSKTLAKQFGDLPALMQADMQRLQVIPDIGPIVAKRIVTFFVQKHHREVIDALLNAGVKWPIGEAQKILIGPLTGQTFVLTGSLQAFTREQAGEKLELLGAKIAGSISKKTTVLIAGIDAGSKLNKAQALHIKIWNESDLLVFLSAQSMWHE
jgi:DNA ligase (NAD+)